MKIILTMDYTGGMLMRNEESKIQAEIVLKLQEKKIFCFSVPNEAAGNNFVRQSLFIATGLKSGVSDLEIWIGEKTLYCEVKSLTGVQSKTQARFQDRCKETGRKYIIVRSWNELDEILKKDYGV